MEILPFDYFLAQLKRGNIMNDTLFYFVDEPGEPDHYIGCFMDCNKPYWAGYCDIPNGTEFYTADELVNAPIYDGRSIKERWSEVRIIYMGGLTIDDYMRYVRHD